jgi:ferredoxin
MAPIPHKNLIVYISPAGSTARVARVIHRTSEALGTPTELLDLGRKSDPETAAARFLDTADNCCLYIGTPVYAAHAVPPIMAFIDRLPVVDRGYCVPFATWGNVSSGIALAEMGDALSAKGYTLLGAAKVVAAHSLMWEVAAALGKEHPDVGDDGVVESLVRAVDAKLGSDEPAPLPLSALAYQPEELAGQMAARTFEIAKSNFPKRQVVPDRCTECGQCADQCPTAAITLSPYPEFGPPCIYCFNCVRLCPENAIEADMAPIHGYIRSRAEQLNEQPLTEAYV